MSRNDDYDVGYKKPPRHTQFEKGRSGNPKGRPRGSLNLATALNKALRETVTVVEHGRRKTITKLDATIKGLINRAVKGDAKAVQQLLGLGSLVGSDAVGPQSLGETDAAVMANLVQRLRSGRPDEAKGRGKGK
jgi:hypothetical protein